MQEVKCPKCRSVFQSNESDGAQIASQVRSTEFDRELAGNPTAQKPAYPRQSAEKNWSFRRDNAIPELRGRAARATSFFRERKDGIGLLSIMFQMKNETDSTSAKYEIEDFLKHPENVRESLTSSNRQLRPANDKAEEPTIKKMNQECAVCPRPVGGNGRRRRKMRYPK